MEARMVGGDHTASEDWKRYDRAFHWTLISACGSGEMMAAYDRIFDRFLRYQVLLVVFRGQVAAEEHDTLKDCALSHDADRARKILERHVGACVDYTLQNRLLPMIAR
jgi:DNA-binding GntR family transcriptional regulator